MSSPYPRALRSRMPFTGHVVDPDPNNWVRPIRGQLTPQTEERWSMWHGRNLAGLGANGAETPETMTDEPDWSDSSLRDLEIEDDVVGSGIFDPSGRSTVHQTMGVMADHPSIPGYIARHPPFTVNTEVSDIASGADVVEVPGGGMFYVERGGQLVGPSGGPSPPPQPREIPPPTSNFETYVTFAPGQPAPPNPPGWDAPRANPVELAPQPRVPRYPPGSPVPSYPQFGPVPMRDISQVSVTPMAVTKSWGTRQPVPPQTRQVRQHPGKAPVTHRDISRVAMQQTPVAGYGAGLSGYRAFGQEAAPSLQKPGWATYAFAGLLVGAATAVFVGALGGGRKSRAR